MSQSKSKSKVQSWKDLEWQFCCATLHFSQQPDIQLSSNFYSRLTWPRLNDFRTNQKPPQKFSFKILFWIVTKSSLTLVKFYSLNLLLFQAYDEHEHVVLSFWEESAMNNFVMTMKLIYSGRVGACVSPEQLPAAK